MGFERIRYIAGLREKDIVCTREVLSLLCFKMTRKFKKIVTEGIRVLIFTPKES